MQAKVRPALSQSGPGPVVLLTLAILIALIVHAIAAISPYDDAFITFRYVQNVTEGRGAVYNIGERVFGISTPLYGVWLTLLHLAMPHVELPVLAVRGNGVFLAAAGLLSYLLLIRYGLSRWMAALAGAAVVLSDGILRASIGGMESSMFLALALGSIYASNTRHDGWAVLLASLTALVRPEGILLVGLIVLARLIDPETRSLPLTLWLALAPLVVWVVAATYYYGTPIPHSIIAKSKPLYPLPPGAALRNLIRHAGDWTFGGLALAGRAVTDLAGRAFRWDRIFAVPVLLGTGALVTVWGLAGWPRIARMSSIRSLLLPGFLASVLVLYAVTNPYLLPWYFPLIHAPWLLFILAAGAPGHLEGKAPTSKMRVVAGYIVIALVCLSAFGPTIAHLAPSDWSLLTRGASSAKQAETLEAYRRTADWVETHSGVAETVAAPEIGMLGYHLDRKIYDACGLVTPEALPFLPVPLEQRGAQQGVISVDFVRAMSPDLVVTLPTFARPSLARSDWFKSAYDLVHVERILYGTREDQGVQVFRRRVDGALNPVTSF